MNFENESSRHACEHACKNILRWLLQYGIRNILSLRWLGMFLNCSSLNDWIFKIKARDMLVSIMLVKAFWCNFYSIALETYWAWHFLKFFFIFPTNLSLSVCYRIIYLPLCIIKFVKITYKLLNMFYVSWPIISGIKRLYLEVRYLRDGRILPSLPIFWRAFRRAKI